MAAGFGMAGWSVASNDQTDGIMSSLRRAKRFIQNCFEHVEQRWSTGQPGQTPESRSPVSSSSSEGGNRRPRNATLGRGAVPGLERQILIPANSAQAEMDYAWAIEQSLQSATPTSSTRTTVPIPSSSDEAHAQLVWALQASEATARAQRPRRQANRTTSSQPGTSLSGAGTSGAGSLYDTGRLRLADALADGDCFFDSLTQLARGELSLAIGKHPDALEPNDIRRHVARHIARSLVLLRDVQGLGGCLMDPYLLAFDAEPPAGETWVDVKNDHNAQAVLCEALGDDAAAEALQSLTPNQLLHLHNLSRERSWNNFAGEIVPAATAAAFPGLKLAIVTEETTERDLQGGHKTFASVEPEQWSTGAIAGTRAPAPHLLFLSGNHYSPAWLRS